jgi:hypothetical protein
MDLSIITNILETFVTTVGAPACIIGALVLVTSYVGFKRGPNQKNIIKDILHNSFTKDSSEKIESIEHKQTKVIAHIKDHEHVETKIKERIQTITNKAAEDIEKIKSMNTIEEVDNYIDDNWSRL